MTVKFSVSVINGFLDSIEDTIGTSPHLLMYSGVGPTLITDPPVGTLLAVMTLPSDWMLNAANGQKILNGLWTVTCQADGTVGYYRIYDTSETTCHEQGSVTRVGLGGDMTLDNTNVTNGQVVTIVSKVFSSDNV